MDSSTNGTLYFSDNDPQIEQEDVRFFSSNNIYVQLNESVFPQNDGKKLIVESANDRFVGIELTPALPPVGISSRHLNSSSGTAS